MNIHIRFTIYGHYFNISIDKNSTFLVIKPHIFPDEMSTFLVIGLEKFQSPKEKHVA